MSGIIVAVVNRQQVKVGTVGVRLSRLYKRWFRIQSKIEWKLACSRFSAGDVVQVNRQDVVGRSRVPFHL